MSVYHYSDYITVNEEYRPVMDKATINQRVDTWLSFFPHIKFLDFLRKLQAQLIEGSKSVWLYGNYGTGKSHAALVTQKLFMDDQSRVDQWFSENASMFPSPNIYDDLIKLRNQGTFVVYDYNASGLEADKEFLVRLEKTIRNALAEANLACPASGALDNTIERIEREGENFFKARDRIQSQLVHLVPEIKTVKELVTRLRTDPHLQDAPISLFSDVVTVLRSDNIYLDVDADHFRNWISDILKANNLKRIVFIFDEFSEFINNHQTELKTFENITENPANFNFYFVPVTHLRMEAFLGVNTPGAKRATDRFDFCELQMPNDTALQLAGKAIRVKKGMTAEWTAARTGLFESIKDLTEKFNDDQTEIKEESFLKLLPVHPMAAFLLKFLSESFQSNQRSIFEYLKGSANGHEFQEFLAEGGPTDVNRQLLTVDYLWKYFVERDDIKLGSNQDIEKVRAQYRIICNRDFKNATDDDPNLRVLRTIMLLWLIEHKVSDGHERLKATDENVKLAFRGTALSGGIEYILRDLEAKHCISRSKGAIELFGMSDTNSQELEAEIRKLDSQFHEFLSDIVYKDIEKSIFGISLTQQYSKNRFDIRVSDLSHATLANLQNATRSRYSANLNTDDGSICLWFVISKTHEEELNIESRARDLLKQLRGHRILLFSFNNQSFCESDLEAWNEYVRLRAQYNLENDKIAQASLKKSFTRLEDEWISKLKQASQTLKKYEWKSDDLEITGMTWGELQGYLHEYLIRTLPYCVDLMAQGQVSAFGDSQLESWARAGMEFESSGKNGWDILIKKFINQGIEKDKQWYSQHPDHPLTQIHELLMKKIENTVGKGVEFSLRKAYLELRRAPFGMRWNGLHAFVLGFALKEILSKSYQWTDGRISRPLDVQSLSEIIKTVVKDDGNGDISNEKKICRMSREEKSFLKTIPPLFGFPMDKDSSMQAVLLIVQNRVKDLTQGVPLWALEEYIKANAESFPNGETLIDILNKLCVAGQTSSKGKTDAQTEAIKSIGASFENNSELSAELASCLKTDCFLQAFQILVDKQRPEFAALAESVHDFSHRYTREILNKTAADSGFLWNRRDISDIIDQTFNEYEVIQLVQRLIQRDDYLNYKSAISALTEAVNQKNHLPLTLITSQYPALSNFVSYINKAGESASNIRDELQQNLKLIQEVFFDLRQNAQIKILRHLFSDIPLDDTQLRQELSNMTPGLSESEFINNFQARLEELAKDSAVLNLRQRWKDFSGCDTPDKWAMENNIPVRYLLGNCPDANDIVKALKDSSYFSRSRIQELLDVLNAMQPVTVEECQKAFLKDMIPAQYAPFKIDFGALVSFLISHESSNPNEWSMHPNLDNFIKERYKSTFAPQIIEKIRAMSAEELKEKVIELARSSQDMGILFMK